MDEYRVVIGGEERYLGVLSGVVKSIHQSGDLDNFGMDCHDCVTFFCSPDEGS